MADDELEAIRAKRLAELQRQQGGDGAAKAQAQAQQQAKEAEMRNVILGQALDQGARTRLNTIAVAKPEKAKMVENLILQMATSGQLHGQKLTEEAFKDLLAQVSSSTQKTTTVKFDRRRAHMDDSDDDY
ncbi:programmed cell death protein 5 [Plakobranchus ocellatus]|uniref:Programmed cell death protein 5 n=1 Tax=Plakobranchus ocellatus TaxID=259542 RepID=A0AAV4C1G6_9GAST|nr:programmed cell death protein 5 [Plakobranchus ocellatus]